MQTSERDHGDDANYDKSPQWSGVFPVSGNIVPTAAALNTFRETEKWHTSDQAADVFELRDDFKTDRLGLPPDYVLDDTTLEVACFMQAVWPFVEEQRASLQDLCAADDYTLHGMHEVIVKSDLDKFFCLVYNEPYPLHHLIKPINSEAGPLVERYRGIQFPDIVHKSRVTGMLSRPALKAEMLSFKDKGYVDQSGSVQIPEREPAEFKSFQDVSSAVEGNGPQVMEEHVAHRMEPDHNYIMGNIQGTFPSELRTSVMLQGNAELLGRAEDHLYGADGSSHDRCGSIT